MNSQYDTQKLYLRSGGGPIVRFVWIILANNYIDLAKAFCALLKIHCKKSGKIDNRPVV